MEKTNGKLAVSLKDAAFMLSMSVRSLERKIKLREIKACRATRHITIPVSELEAFIKRNTV